MTFYSPPLNSNEKEQADMTNLWEYVPHNSHHNLSFVNNKNSEVENEENKEVIVEVVKFSVIGLLMTAEFQKCKYIVEALNRCYPEKYEEPVIEPMMNLEWNEFLLNERRSKGGAFWSLKEPVAVYYNDEFMGDDRTLTKYVSSRYILPMKNFYRLGRMALKNRIMEIIDQGRSCIYLMISIDKVITGTMLFMLYDDLVPNTCRLFLDRCRKVNGGYTGTPIHRIVAPSWIQCGGYRLKEMPMPCENYSVSHDKRGVLSMCNSGNHKNNTTQFMITLENTKWMDTHYVAFGQLLHGDWVLNQIESTPTYYQMPKKEVKIVKAGEYSLYPSKLKQGTTTNELQNFLDKRLKQKTYHHYSTHDELKLEKIVQRNELKREYLDTDLHSYFPLEMLPENILDSFNYVTDKKSSCFFEMENCTKCGCSHDVGKCMRDSSSRSSNSS